MSIVWATLLRALVFGEPPSPWTTLGALLIVASGLYIFHREREASRTEALTRST